VTGWNPLFELWQSGDVPTGDDASDGLSFTVHARSHGVDPLDVAVTGGLDVAGLRRAVLVTEDRVTWVALADAPPDAATVTVGPGAPSDAWVSPTWMEGEDAGVGWYVDAAVARVVAYQDMDASGSWSRGDAVAAQACLDGTFPVTVAWVAPTRDPRTLYERTEATALETGWSLTKLHNGQRPLTDDELGQLRWCRWTG
jgi:hypothetical protein